MTAEPQLRVAGVRSILALRPNAIGDFVFSLPALHTLKHAYPDAAITFVGKRWHADFLRDRPGPIDEVVVMPPYPGVGAGSDAPADSAAALRFIGAMRDAEFDLAVQMYGGGRYSNAFINRLGAKLTIGARTPDAAALDRSISYGDFANRRLELLQVVALAGARAYCPEREIAVTDNDRRLAAQAMPHVAGQRLVLVQPGVSDPRRRWPVERFAQVADALAQDGATIVVSGSPDETPLVRAVIAGMRYPAVDLGGGLALPALCGLLERCALLLSNDSGPLHLSLAIGTPCVGVFWLTNLMEAGPLRPQLLRPALSVRTHCPVCGEENRKTRCPHDVCFVDDVPMQDVRDMAIELFRATA
jgi:ADP-heptose:LPS heptosyltransferase